MTLRNRILRDLINGQSTADAISIRFQIPQPQITAACDELELDLLISSHLLGGILIIHRLTPAGRQEATTKPTP